MTNDDIQEGEVLLAASEAGEFTVLGSSLLPEGNELSVVSFRGDRQGNVISL